MKKLFFFLGFLFLLGVIVVLFLSSRRQPTQSTNMYDNTIKITSPSFVDGENIPEKFTCDGANINPQLDISDVSEETQSLALVVEDPDTSGGTFIHWLVFNIDPQTRLVAVDSTPNGGTLGKNGFGLMGYGGPCPPSGTHHYIFNVYALDAKLNLAEGVDYREFTKAIKNHVIATGKLTGLYGKK